jgi:PAS domain S-box-containing protein
VQSTVSTGDTQRERTLDRVQDTFRAVFDEAFDAMVIADDDDHIIDANQSAADLFGVPARDLRGRQLAEFMKDEATADSIWHSSNDTTQGRETVPIVRTDGTEAILEYTTTANIVPGHHLAIMRDVTSHRDREQQLEVAETIFQNTQDALFLIDVTDQEEFRIQRVNDTYRDLTGLSNDDIRGLTPQETVGEAVGTDIEARYRECVKRGETIEYSEEIPVDGETRYWQTKLTPIHHDGTVSKLVGAMRDITERVARQRALERYETVLETIEDAAWILDRKKQLTFVNRALVEKLSITTEQAEGAPLAAFQEFFSDPGTFETYETLVDDMLAGVAEEGDLDVTLDLPQGEQDVNVRVVPLLGDDGPTGVVGIARDITGRKEHERELAVKTRAIEEAPIGITMTDASRPDNPLVYANKAFEQLTGYAAEEIRGRNCRFLQGERTDPDTVATIRDAIDAEQPVSVDVRNYRSDGTEFWNHLTVAPVTNNTGDVIRYVGFQQDITGRREQEREFSQLEYVLEAVLSTASGILWTTDEEGIITRARGAALAHFGVKPDEVVGNAVDDVFNAQSSVGEHTARALDGERVTATLTIGDATFDVWYGPLNADDGDLVGTVGFAALTNRNRSSQSHD